MYRIICRFLVTYIILYYVIMCCIVSYCIISYHVLYNIILYNTILYHIMFDYTIYIYIYIYISTIVILYHIIAHYINHGTQRRHGQVPHLGRLRRLRSRGRARARPSGGACGQRAVLRPHGPRAGRWSQGSALAKQVLSTTGT